MEKHSRSVVAGAVFLCLLVANTVTADSNNIIFHALTWMKDDALRDPHQMAAVNFQNGTSGIFIAEFGSQIGHCLRRLDNVSSGLLDVVDSTCSVSTGIFPTGVIAVPAFFNIQIQLPDVTKGLIFSGHGNPGKAFYLPLLPAAGAAQKIDISGGGAGWLNGFYLASYPFRWGTTLRFFSPQFESDCILLLSTSVGAVDAGSGEVLYNGGQLSAAVAAGKCGNQGSVDGAALTVAQMGVIWAVAHYTVSRAGGNGALYASDFGYSCLRRCFPIADDGGTLNAFCKILINVGGNGNCRALRLLRSPPEFASEVMVVLLWGVLNKTGGTPSYRLARVIDNELMNNITGRGRSALLDVSRIGQGLPAMVNDALQLSDGQLLLTLSTNLRVSLLAAEGVDIVRFFTTSTTITGGSPSPSPSITQSPLSPSTTLSSNNTLSTSDSSNKSLTSSSELVISASHSATSSSDKKKTAAKVVIVLPTIVGEKTAKAVTGGTAVVAGGIGGMTVPSIAVQAGRTRSLSQLALCDAMTDDDGLPPWFVFPLQLEVSNSDPMPKAVGIVLYTSLLLLLLPALMWFAARWQLVTTIPPKFTGSLLVAFFSYFAPSLPEVSVALILFGPLTAVNIGYFGIGSVSILLVVFSIILFFHDPEEATTENDDNDGSDLRHAVAIHTNYLLPFYFDAKDARNALHRCALLEEIGVGIALSAVAGSAPRVDLNCSAGSWLSLLLGLFHLAFVSFLRPYAERSVVALSIVNAFFLVVLSLGMVAASIGIVDKSSMAEANGNVALAQFCILGFQAVWVLFQTYLRNAKRHHEKQQQDKKEVEEELTLQQPLLVVVSDIEAASSKSSNPLDQMEGNSSDTDSSGTESPTGEDEGCDDSQSSKSTSTTTSSTSMSS